MKERKGIFSWENEPADARRSEFRSTVGSGWEHSVQSTFAEPSRLDSRQHVRSARRERERRRRRLWAVVATLALSALAAAWALWPTLQRHLQR